jgi:hypothetical protein
MNTDPMAAAHARDYANQARMRDLRLALLQYLNDPPAWTSQKTRAAIVQATSYLSEDMRQIDRQWN